MNYGWQNNAFFPVGYIFTTTHPHLVKNNYLSF